MPADVVALILFHHDPLHILVSVLVCLAGACLSVRILRALGRTGPAPRPYWASLLAIICGGAIWTTHFVAMLGFRPEIASGYLGRYVALSLAVIVGAVLLAALVGAARRPRFAPEAGGLILGGGIAAMHYVGMAGYAIACGVAVDPAVTGLAVALSCLGGALTFNRGLRGRHPRHLQTTAALVVTVGALHFLGMAGLLLDTARVVAIPAAYFSGQGLVLPVTLVMLMVLAVGLSTLQIDRIAGAESVARLRRAARTDPLTGLPNRAGFARAHRRFRTAAGPFRPHLLLSIDLDDFKAINDRHGDAAGDAILRETAARLRSWLPPGAVAARIGGDEFLVAVPGDISADQAATIGRSLVAALARPVRVDGAPVPTGCSVGMILCPGQAGDEAGLFSGAELALHAGRRAGRNRASLFDPGMARQHRERRQLGDDLVGAVEAGALTLFYQPQQDLVTGEVTGFEALLRWPHPTRGLLLPHEFVPLAEERGLTLPLGEWALRQAVAEAATWTRPCRIAVNVAAPQLEAGTLPDLLRRVLDESGLPPHRLELEITETTVISDLPRTQRQAAALKAIGVTLAMDDYGTGHSALATLLALPFDRLKFDRSFIARMEADPRMLAVLASTVDLGWQIGMRVLAEGVETGQQAQALLDIGCKQVQGALVGPAEPADEIRRRFELDLGEVERWDRDLDAERDAAGGPKENRFSA